MDHHSHSHTMLHEETQKKTVEYLKFAGVLLLVVGLALLHSTTKELNFIQFSMSFMGSFFIVFASFKLRQLREFAYGFQSYDILAKRSLAYAYIYPFLQLLFGSLYLLGIESFSLHFIVLVVSLFSALGVLRTIGSGAKVHCVCLGTVIKLPLSTISFVEDFGMALMAFVMLLIQA